MKHPTTLAVDIGGTGIKAAVFDARGALVDGPVRAETSYPAPPAGLVAQVQAIALQLPAADRLGVGFPGLLRSDRVVWVNSLSRATPGGRLDDELARQWIGFNVASALSVALSCPTRVANDADVAALACISGRGLECVITLGTGLGFSLAQDGILLPHLELSGAPFLDGRDFEAALGNAALEADGPDTWAAHVRTAVQVLRGFVYFDHLYIGGGNARLLQPGSLGEDVSLVDNANGLLGGYRLWGQGAA